MKILITGASGFVGGYVVREALGRGHEVLALSRTSPRAGAAALAWLAHDLAADVPPALTGLGIDVVVHLAAALSGSQKWQQRVTGHGTRQLMDAMLRADIRNLVGISSISVLDFPRLSPLSLIDEGVAVSEGAGMGAYAQAKRDQESLFAEFLKRPRTWGSVLRPGIVYDEKHLLDAYAGVFHGSLRLLVSHRGEVPVIEARGLARAIVSAAERKLSGAEVIHLVDDKLPGLPQYWAALHRRGALPSTGIPVPWRLLATCAFALRTAGGLAGYSRRLPEALRRHGFAARFKPFRYANHKAKRLLSWVPGCRFG